MSDDRDAIRRELIETLRTHDIDSVRHLARCVEHGKGQVSHDLGVLAEHGVIKYEEEYRTKRPYLVQEYVIFSPVSMPWRRSLGGDQSSSVRSQYGGTKMSSSIIF